MHVACPHDSSCPLSESLLLAFAAKEQMRREAHKAARGKTWARGQSTPRPARTPHAEVGWHASGGAPMHDTRTHTHGHTWTARMGHTMQLYTRSKQETASRHQWSRHLPVNVLELHAGRSSAHRGLALCPSLHERRPDW